MKKRVLVSWIGMNDIRASKGTIEKGTGAIDTIAQSSDFDQIYLLTNYSKEENNNFKEWIETQREIKTQIVNVTLSSPTNYDDIYTVASETLAKYIDKDTTGITFNISSGTPAMSTCWILLAMTKYNNSNIMEASIEEGAKEVQIPFDISADYIPRQSLQERDKKISKMLDTLPPLTKEFEQIIHRCDVMHKQITRARRLAQFDCPVLILGESGTGKEVFANAIHRSSSRGNKELVSINCGAIPENLIESELFGYVKGAFTGADKEKIGLIESANHSTLFLDEIGELPLKSQVRLLRVLQEKKVYKLGSTKEVTVDFRVIAATNKNLADEVKDRNFREDLFHRIAVGIMKLPPLRERDGDINILSDFFLERINKQIHASHINFKDWQFKSLSAGARNILNKYPWPGNVRELEHILQRAVIWSTEDIIGSDEIYEAAYSMETSKPPEDLLTRPFNSDFNFFKLLGEVYHQYYLRARKESNNNKKRAAEMLGFQSYQKMDDWYKRYVFDLKLSNNEDESNWKT